MRVLAVAVFLLGCTPTAMPMSPTHPARADAPTGRLAGPPVALRPGVVEVPVETETAPPSTELPAPAHQGHEGHEGHR